MLKRKTLEGDHVVDRVLGEWHPPGGRQLLTRWKGYNFLGDTWEPEELSLIHISEPTRPY